MFEFRSDDGFLVKIPAAVAAASGPQNVGPDAYYFLNVQTGELLEELGKQSASSYDSVIRKADFLLFTDPKLPWMMFDTRNKKKLWAKNPLANRTISAEYLTELFPVFEDDESFTVRYWGDGRVITDRFSIIDGQSLDKQVSQLEPKQLSGIKNWQSAGRFAVFQYDHPCNEGGRKLDLLYDDIALRVGLPRRGIRPRVFVLRHVLYDQTAAREIAHFDCGYSLELLDEQNFVLIGDRLGYYSMPPRRAWDWWLVPAAAPFVMWYGGRQLGRWFSRRRGRKALPSTFT